MSRSEGGNFKLKRWERTDTFDACDWQQLFNPETSLSSSSSSKRDSAAEEKAHIKSVFKKIFRESPRSSSSKSSKSSQRPSQQPVILGTVAASSSTVEVAATSNPDLPFHSPQKQAVVPPLLAPTYNSFDLPTSFSKIIIECQGSAHFSVTFSGGSETVQARAGNDGKLVISHRANNSSLSYQVSVETLDRRDLLIQLDSPTSTRSFDPPVLVDVAISFPSNRIFNQTGISLVAIGDFLSILSEDMYHPQISVNTLKGVHLFRRAKADSVDIKTRDGLVDLANVECDEMQILTEFADTSLFDCSSSRIDISSSSSGTISVKLLCEAYKTHLSSKSGSIQIDAFSKYVSLETGGSGSIWGRLEYNNMSVVTYRGDILLHLFPNSKESVNTLKTTTGTINCQFMDFVGNAVAKSNLKRVNLSGKDMQAVLVKPQTSTAFIKTFFGDAKNAIVGNGASSSSQKRKNEANGRIKAKSVFGSIDLVFNETASI